MGFDDNMYMLKPKDEKQYDYWECKVTLGDQGTSVGQELRQADKFAAEQCRKKAPNGGDGWVLDHIVVTGSMILPGKEPLGRIFVFRRPKQKGC